MTYKICFFNCIILHFQIPKNDFLIKSKNMEKSNPYSYVIIYNHLVVLILKIYNRLLDHDWE